MRPELSVDRRDMCCAVCFLALESICVVGEGLDSICLYRQPRVAVPYSYWRALLCDMTMIVS